MSTGLHFFRTIAFRALRSAVRAVRLVIPSKGSSASFVPLPEGTADNEAASADALPQCRALAAAGDWYAIVALTGDERAVLQQPRLLFFRLKAARALGDERLFEEIVRKAVALPDELPTKTNLLRDFARSGYRELMIRVLIANPDLRTHLALSEPWHANDTSLTDKCRKLAAVGDWHAIVTLTGDESAVLQQPRLLFFRLKAARALGDARLFEDVVRRTMTLPDELPTKTDLRKEFSSAGHREFTDRVVLANPGLRAHPAFSEHPRANDPSLMGKCRELAAAGDWHAIVALTADEQTVLREPQLLFHRLKAAGALGAMEQLDDTVRLTALLPNDSPLKEPLLRRLASGGQHEAVARIFLEDPSLGTHSHIGRIIHIVLRRLAEAADWSAVLKLTADEQSVLREPQLLVHRLKAAEALGAREQLDDIARLTALLPNDSSLKGSLLRRLASGGQYQAVARILIDHPSFRTHPHFRRRSRSVMRGLLDRDVQRELRQATAADGLWAHAQLSSFSFAPRPSAFPTLGSVRLAAGPRVASRHIAGLQKQIKIFRKQVHKTIEKQEQPTVLELCNVFTDRFGQIWTEDGQIIHGAGRPIAQVKRETVPQVTTAMKAHSGTRGFYHWLVDRVPPLAWLNEPANDAGTLPILISDKESKFVISSLEMLGLAERVQLVGDALFVERLIIPRVGAAKMVGWSHVDWALKKLVDVSMTKAKEAGVKLPDRVYISRRDAKRRPLSNELAVESAVRQRNFVVYEFSNLPLWHQIAVAHSAKVLVGPHGAGLSHLILAQSGTKVVEIIPIIDEASYHLRFLFARLSTIKGLAYHGWIEVQEPLVEEWTLDVEPFLSFLDKALAQRPLTARRGLVGEGMGSRARVKSSRIDNEIALRHPGGSLGV